MFRGLFLRAKGKNLSWWKHAENNMATNYEAFPFFRIYWRKILQNIAEFLNEFAIQLAESAHVSNTSQFMVFSRCCFSNEVHLDSLLRKPLKRIKYILSGDFFNKNNVLWKKHCKWNHWWNGCFYQNKKGSQSKVTERAPPIEFIHHIIYRETAAANK